MIAVKWSHQDGDKYEFLVSLSEGFLLYLENYELVINQHSSAVCIKQDHVLKTGDCQFQLRERSRIN